MPYRSDCLNVCVCVGPKESAAESRFHKTSKCKLMQKFEPTEANEKFRCYSRLCLALAVSHLAKLLAK